MMESVGNSLPEVVTTLLQQWRSISKPRQRDLLRVCARKYGDLEKVHENFLAILNELHTLLVDAIVNERPVDAELIGKLKLLEERRQAGRPARLAGYVEAQVYAEAKPARFAGILRKIPRPIADAVKKFMGSYTHYFEHDRSYNHEAARAIRESVYFVGRVARSSGAFSNDTHGRECLRFVGNLHDSIDRSWLNVSRDYYRLYSAFLDHGIVLE